MMNKIVLKVAAKSMRESAWDTEGGRRCTGFRERENMGRKWRGRGDREIVLVSGRLEGPLLTLSAVHITPNRSLQGGCVSVGIHVPAL